MRILSSISMRLAGFVGFHEFVEFMLPGRLSTMSDVCGTDAV